ncbi:hypothetical protein HRbin01_00231 [archaeon HR01]|nr:hypothetical protein HRbin01_00231 [archaeon HR01]
MSCPECGGVIHEDEETGELYCLKCGLVVLEKTPTLEPTPHEIFSDDKRFGPKLTRLLPDSGLGTLIKGGRKSFSRIHNTISSDGESRSLRKLLSEVVWVSSRLGVSREVSERAAALCRIAVSKKPPRCPLRALAASAIYLSLKEMGFTRTLQELSAAADIPLSTVAKCLGFYVFTLGVRNRQPEPEAVISRIGNALELGREVCWEAEQIYTKLRSRGLTAGRRPVVVASAALYLVCRRRGIRLPASRIAEAAGISDATLRKLVRAAANIDGLMG